LIGLKVLSLIHSLSNKCWKFGGRPSPVSFQDLLMRASNGVLNPSVCNEALNITTSSTSKDDACIQRKDVQILSIQFVATEMLE
jgi:hypothetical protein